MLISLQIDNYALIRSLKIDFDANYTVITGETGAGKSIILGALSLVLGNRADTSVLLDKTRKCAIEACFRITALNLKPFFQTNELDYAEETILRREITDNGKSRSFINDTPVNLQTLKDLAIQLVDIHSQHHNLLFHQASFGLKIVDEFSGNPNLLNNYQNIYKQYQEIENQCEALRLREQQEASERDFLQYIVRELQEANITPDEQTELEKEQTFLQNASDIKTKLYSSNQLLAEQENNIVQLLQESKSDLASIAAFDETIAHLEHRLNDVLVEIKDVAFDVNRKEQAIEINPAELERITARLDYIYALQQKHRVSNVEELLQKLHDSETELLKINNYRTQLEELLLQKDLLYETLCEQATLLSKTRKEKIPLLEQAINEKIKLLGMEDGIIQFDVSSHERHTLYGIDHVKALFSANKGVPVEEIAKVASGGELSRLMLAVKSVLSASAFLPTVVFDEIDAGISGEVAGKVASLTQNIASQRQLVVITHLPQIAAKGNLHYFVYKESDDKQTTSNIKPLSEQERIIEIAKMMSGNNPGEASLAASKELILNRI